MEEGIVYILTNPAMPNLVKIGMTTRLEVGIRMSELYTTGVPVPFECSFAGKVADVKKTERAFHKALAKFFKVNILKSGSDLPFIPKDFFI